MYTKYVQFIHPLSNVSGTVHHDRVVYHKKDPYHLTLIHSRCKTQWLVICGLYRESKLITKAEYVVFDGFTLFARKKVFFF